MERRGGDQRKGLPTREKSKKVPPLDENSEDGEEGTFVSDGGEEEKKRRLSSPTGTGRLSSPSSTGVLRKGGGVGGSTGQFTCQAEKCTEDLTDARRYYRRHKVCEVHSKAAVVIVAGLRQRFCQQCSRFHDLSEFDDTKRSCRKRLAGHNERRRKISSETQGRLEPLQAG